MVLVHPSHTEGRSRQTAAETRASVVVLLAASKQNFHGTEEKKTCQDDLALKLSGFNSRQAFAGVIKNQEEDLQRVQAFPKWCHLSWVSGEWMFKASQCGFDPKEANFKTKLLLAPLSFD